MAGTVSTDLTFFTGATSGNSSADTITDWTGTPTPVVDTAQFVQGSASLYTYQAASSTSRTWIFTCTSTSTTSKVIYFWFALGKVSFLSTKASGGLTLRIESSATDYLQWNVAGSDTLPHNGFICHAVHTSQPADTSGGSCNTGAITKVTIVANGSFPGKSYLWVDALRVGTYLQLKGGTTASPATMQDFATAEEITANQYGVLSKFVGVYFVQGQLLIGSTTSGDSTYFKDTSQVVAFKNALIPAGFYEIKLQGNATGTTQKVYFGNKSGSSGIQGFRFMCESSSQTPRYKFTATDTNITDLGIYGCGFSAANAISLPVYSATREVLNTSFENCDQVLPDTCIVKNCNFIGGGEIYLLYTSQTVNYVVGSIVTGGTSGATGRIVSDTDWGTTGLLELRFVKGTFSSGETLTGSGGGSATVNGTAGNLYITYGSQTVNYTVGNTLTGGSSGATSIIRGIQDDGATGKLVLESANHVQYVNSETLTGSGGGNGTSTALSTSVGTIAIKMTSTSHNITDDNFISCSKAIEIDSANTYAFSNLKFSGSVFDIRNSSTGSVIVNATNGANPTSYENTNGGTTTINNAITIAVKKVTYRARCRIENASTGTAYLSDYATTPDTDNPGYYKATASINDPGVVTVNIIVRQVGYLPYLASGEINGGLSVTPVWQTDTIADKVDISA